MTGADGQTIVVKLGGSVVTVKDEPETVDESSLATVADALAGADARTVVVHGGGSFGHHHADAHGVTAVDGTTDATAVRDIHGAMVALNRRVVAALADAGLPAIPVHPLSVASRDAEGALDLPATGVRRALAEGFVPVLHGDVVAHEGVGATVLSGDEIVVEAAAAVGADRVGVCSTVDGVLDEDGSVVERIDTYDDVAPLLGGSDATDVTGGMAGKVRALLDTEAPAQVFGPDDLAAFVAGDAPGTTVDGR